MNAVSASPSRSLMLFGIAFDKRNAVEIADHVMSEEGHDDLRIVCTANVDHIVNLHRNDPYRRAYESAYLSTIDGMPVYLYARARGVKVEQRVAGSDLFPLLLERAVPGKHRLAFLSPNKAVSEFISAYLNAKGFPASQYLMIEPPFGFEKSPEATQKILSQVRALKATHLFSGVGSPKTEIWLHQNSDELGGVYAFGFGAGLEYFAGTLKRAPRAFQVIGMEWLWRLLSDPRRLYRRYLIDSWAFFDAIRHDLNGQSSQENNK